MIVLRDAYKYDRIAGLANIKMIVMRDGYKNDRIAGRI